MNNFRVFIHLAISQSSLANAIKISLIVGLILNLINQGDRLFDLEYAQIDYLKFFLTFLVPFLVSTYASTTTKLQFFVDDLAFVGAQLICKHCKMKTIDLNKGEIIPPCDHCHENTRWKAKEIKM